MYMAGTKSPSACPLAAGSPPSVPPTMATSTWPDLISERAMPTASSADAQAVHTVSCGPCSP